MGKESEKLKQCECGGEKDTCTQYESYKKKAECCLVQPQLATYKSHKFSALCVSVNDYEHTLNIDLGL